MTKGTITLPIVPGGPSWIWAIVGVKPLAVTLPLTDPSAAMLIVPSAAAELLIGGTSFSPESTRWKSSPNAAVGIPAATAMAKDHADNATAVDLEEAFIVELLLLKS